MEVFGAQGHEAEGVLGSVGLGHGEKHRLRVRLVLTIRLCIRRYLLAGDALPNKVLDQGAVVAADAVFLHDGERSKGQATAKQTVKGIASSRYQHATM